MIQSFSQKVKYEISNIIISRQNALIEMSSLIILNGKIINLISDDHSNIVVSTENKLIATKLFTLIYNSFRIYPNISVQIGQKKPKYLLCITPSQGSLRIIQAMKYSIDFIDKRLFKNIDDHRAFIRSCFLSNGTINDPNKSYHLEFFINNGQLANQLANSIDRFNIKLNITKRGTTSIIYLKDSESIVKLLNIIGAHKSLFEYENIRLLKEVRNNINRKVNFETANLGRTATASSNQIKSIKIIESTIGLDALDEPLYEVASLRLKYPNASLKELGDYCNPPLGKSGINHRLKKLIEIAEKCHSHKEDLC